MHAWVQRCMSLAALMEVHVLNMCSQLSADSLQSAIILQTHVLQQPPPQWVQAA